MSYTTLYIFKGSVVDDVCEYGNSHGGAMAIWSLLSRRHLGQKYPPILEMESVWALADDESVPWYARLALISTFDRVVFRRDDLPTLARAFELFTEDYYLKFKDEMVFSVPAQATDIRDAYEDGAQAVAWCQTSVGDSHFGGTWDDSTEKTLPFRLDGKVEDGDEGHWYADLSFVPESEIPDGA